jgi:hypothetical protein
MDGLFTVVGGLIGLTGLTLIVGIVIGKFLF